MGMDYYFYKKVDERGRGISAEDYVDSSRWCGVPDSDVLEQYGAQRIKPMCSGCEYEENSKGDEYFSKIRCYECWDNHTTYLVTREQALKIQETMQCNETLFTDMMDKANQDYIYIRYDY